MTLSSVKYDDVAGGRIYTNFPVCHMACINFGRVLFTQKPA